MINASYKEICRKLGHDPFVHLYELKESWIHDDNVVNPYSILNDDEIYLLEQIEIATKNIRNAFGMF